MKEYDADGGQSSSRTLLSSPNVANAIHGGERESYLKENEKQEVVSFLEALCPPIVTEDVINNNSFVASAIPWAKAYNYYQELCQEYRKQELRKGRGSKFSKMKEIDGLIQDLRSKLKEANKIDLDLSSGTSALAFKATRKQKFLSETTARFVRAHSKLTDGDVLRALRRRLSQQKQVKSRPFTRHPQEQLILECPNSETLTWEEVYNNLEHLPDGVLTALLQLCDLAMVLEEALCMTLGNVVGAFSIASDDVDKALTAIIQNFPVLYVSNGRVRVLINVHEMVLTPDVFEEILAIND